MLTATNGKCNTVDFYNNKYVFAGAFSGTTPASNYKYVGIIDLNIVYPPSIASTNFFASNITYNSMQINWTNGHGNSRLVIAYEFPLS